MNENNNSQSEILLAIANLQTNLTENINELKLEIQGKHEKIEKSIENIQNNQETITREIAQLKRENRKLNIIIGGVAELEKGYLELEQTIQTLFTDLLKINCLEGDIVFANRLGKKQENKNRPIKVTLSTWGKKIKIFNNKKALKDTGIFITDDFPPEVVEKRKQLTPILLEKRKEGHHAIIKYDTLYVNREKYEADNTTNRKRPAEKSPENPVTNTNKYQKPSTSGNKQNRATLRTPFTPQPANRNRSGSLTTTPKETNFPVNNLTAWIQQPNRI